MQTTQSSITHQIIESIAEREGVESTDLPPLYEAVDPDLLNELIRSIEQGVIAFDYSGYRVIINSDNRVQVTQSFR